MKPRSARYRPVWLYLAFVAFGIALASGCGQAALPPPVQVTYRDSVIGAGKVIQITNTSSRPLYNVQVVGRNFEEGSNASTPATGHLSPGCSVEVGWLEFDSWTPLSGETVEVYCDNYDAPYVSVIP